VARKCPHGIDLTNFNCETCASEYAAAHPQDKKPFPEAPPFQVYHDGEEWVCELDNYTGRGKTIGRAIDAAVTIGLGFGRSRSLKKWVKDHRYTITAISLEPEEEEDEQ
jgi:hypothetical protein